MKTDLYTKTLLTIIAVCLTINVVKEMELFPAAYASEAGSPDGITSEYRLVPVNESGAMDVRIVDIATYDELNVNLKNIDTNDEIKVNLKRIETTDELDVNIDEVGGGWISHGGPIKVKVE